MHVSKLINNKKKDRSEDVAKSVRPEARWQEVKSSRGDQNLSARPKESRSVLDENKPVPTNFGKVNKKKNETKSKKWNFIFR